LYTVREIGPAIKKIIFFSMRALKAIVIVFVRLQWPKLRRPSTAIYSTLSLKRFDFGTPTFYFFILSPNVSQGTVYFLSGAGAAQIQYVAKLYAKSLRTKFGSALGRVDF
jgi:hypothetical protein